MIIAILGNIGEGKSLSIVREIIQKKQYAFVNFNLKNLKNQHRIKFNDVIIPAEKLKDYRVNWEFWNDVRKKNPIFSIYID